MTAVKDHKILVEKGFYDFNKWPVRIAAGTKMRVTKEEYNLMKGSDPDSIQLEGVSPPPEIVQAIVEAARKEKRAKTQVSDPLEELLIAEEETQVSAFEVIADVLEFEPTEDYQAALDADGDTLVDPPEDIEEWEPIGWYKAQLSKGGGLDE